LLTYNCTGEFFKAPLYNRLWPDEENSMKLSAKNVAYAVAAFTPTFGILLIILTRYPIVYGVDGPYYLIQLRNLISEGVIKYPDPPLTYYLLLPFYLMVADKNLGLKLAVAFYGGLTALVLYLSFRKLGDLSGLTAAFAFVICPSLLGLQTTSLKTMLASSSSRSSSIQSLTRKMIENLLFMLLPLLLLPLSHMFYPSEFSHYSQ